MAVVAVAAAFAVDYTKTPHFVPTLPFAIVKKSSTAVAAAAADRDASDPESDLHRHEHSKSHCDYY